MSEKKLIISPYGFDIKMDTLYEVQEKFDSSAPDGFQQARTSKLMSLDIEDSYAGAVWDSIKNNWDTGLYEGSRALAEAFPDADVKPILRNLQDHIVRPFEKEVGEGKLSHIASPETNAFWDNYRIQIKRGRVFNTANAKDRLDLFFSIIHKKLTPKALESSPEFKQPISYYLVVDQEGKISKESESELERMKATASFFTLLQNSKDDLFTILDYLGMPVGKNSDETTLVRMFNNWLNDRENKYQNDRLFNKTVKEYGTEDGKEIFFIYSKLKELKNKEVVKYKRGEIWMDDIYIENGYKNSAQKIKDDKELYEIFTSLID